MIFYFAMTNSWSLLYDVLNEMEDNSFTIDTSLDEMIPDSQNPNLYKYSEARILKELSDYISATYNQHYSAGNDKIQTLDLIDACGDAEAFCRSNILKYASRYDKKGTARRDIMKICLLYTSPSPRDRTRSRMPSSA